MLTEGGVDYADPGFLIEQKEVHVVQKGCAHACAFFVVSASYDQKRLVEREIRHRMPESRNWSHALLLHGFPLDCHYLVVHHRRLQICDFVRKQPLLIPTTEVVDSILDDIRQSNYAHGFALDSLLCLGFGQFGLLLGDDCCTSTLSYGDYRCVSVGYLTPVVVLQVERVDGV